MLGEHPPVRHLAVKNVLDERGQAIEDLVQEGGILFHPDPRRVHVDADDRLEQAHERPGYGLQAGLAEKELGQLPAVRNARLLHQSGPPSESAGTGPGRMIRPG